MRYKKKAVRLLSLALIAAIAASIFASTGAFAAQQDEAISDLALAYGAEGVQTLEESGYAVMGRPVSDDVWLGYKKSGDAVTGLIVSSAQSDSVTADGIDYLRVGSLGDAGSLYLTRDSAAGDAVISLSLKSDEGLVDQPLYALKNDGTSPLRRDDGTPCDLGVDNTAYLFILRENVFRPYISGVTVVCGDDLRCAIAAAATAGCEYYYDPDMRTKDGQTVVLGYTRTANEADAITCLAAGTDAPEAGDVHFESAGDVLFAGDEAFRLFMAKDRAVGNPIVALTGSAVPVRASDVMNKWAEKTFVRFNTSAASVNQIKSETLYRQYLSDDGALTHVPVLDVSADCAETPLAYTCEADGLPKVVFTAGGADEQSGPATEAASETEIATEAASATEIATEDATVTEAASATEAATAVESETKAIAATEAADSFDPEGYLEEEAEKIANDGEDDYVTASVFGDGTTSGVIIVIVLAVLGAGVGFALYAVSVRRKKKEEGSGDEN